MEFLNDLINSGWSILENGFDLQAFLAWKQMSLCLSRWFVRSSSFLHPKFQAIYRGRQPQRLLAAEGILTAAKRRNSKGRWFCPRCR